MKSNSELINDLKCDCNFAFGELYLKYFDMVLRYVNRNSGNQFDAEDIFQDTMVVLCKKLQSDDFTLTASLKTYIMAIAKNLWLKKLSINKRQSESQPEIAESYYENLEISIENEFSLAEKLIFYIEKISKHCIELIRDLFFNNKSLKEVQVDYGYKNRHTVQNIKYKCLNQIKKVKENESLLKKKTTVG